jgi:hypothetical protein
MTETTQPIEYFIEKIENELGLRINEHYERKVVSRKEFRKISEQQLKYLAGKEEGLIGDITNKIISIYSSLGAGAFCQSDNTILIREGKNTPYINLHELIHAYQSENGYLNITKLETLEKGKNVQIKESIQRILDRSFIEGSYHLFYKRLVYEGFAEYYALKTKEVIDKKENVVREKVNLCDLASLLKYVEKKKLHPLVKSALNITKLITGSYSLGFLYVKSMTKEMEAKGLSNEQIIKEVSEHAPESIDKILFRIIK